MAEPYTQVYLHLVWATWDRLPLVKPAWKEALLACIQSQCEKLNVTVGAKEVLPDHAHLLVRIPTTITVAELLKQVKGVSSHLITQTLAPGEWFKWQGGYGVFSVSKSDVRRVRTYIQNQELRHRDNMLDAELEQTSVE